MNGLQKLLMTAGAAGAALVLLGAPAVAEEEPSEDAPTEEAGEAEEDPADAEAETDGAPAEAEAGEDDRIPIAETPRDRVGLILLVALLLGGGAAAANAKRQFKGERPQATGEFRWR